MRVYETIGINHFFIFWEKGLHKTRLILLSFWGNYSDSREDVCAREV
jgi:hypothetical protein